MASPILSIPVDDEAFKNFYSLFQDYQEALKQLPGSWQNVNKATGESGITLNELAAALLTQNELLRESVSSHKAVGKAASGASDKIGGIEKHIDSITKKAKKLTLEFVKWTALSPLMFAGISAFSLFGIDKLAASASQISRNARGLGVDPAAQQAFDVNYARYVDPNSMLSNTAGMQADMSKWGAFMAAGISTQEIQNDDPEELSRRVIQRTKELYDQAGPNGRTAQFMQAHGLDQLLPGGLQDFKRIGGTSQADLDQSEQDERRDRRAFALDPRALKEWTDFTNQMHRAGTTMQDVLIGKLAPLAGPLTDLSAAITRGISSLLDDPDLGDWIKGLGADIEEFAAYLTSPKFKSDMLALDDDFHAFTKAMGELLGWVVKKLVWLGVISDPDAGADGSPHGDGPWNDPQNPDYRPGGRAPDTRGPTNWPTRSDVAPDGIPLTPGDLLRKGLRGLGFGQNGVDANGRRAGDPGYNANTDPANAPNLDAWRRSAIQVPNAALAGLERAAADKYGVPPDLQAAIYAQEHGLNPDGSPAISPAGAIGLGQLMPGTAQDLGVNPFDTAQNIDGSTRYMKKMLDLFGGDQLAAAAAYNWGPNGSHRAVIERYAASGDTDETGLPEETRKYVHAMIRKYGITAHPVEQETPLPKPGSSSHLTSVINALKQRPAAGSRTSVTIDNRTGGDAVVTASQLAH